MQIRRRRLPHLTVIGQPLFVTFRLHGSPGRSFPDESLTSGKAFVSMDRLLDHNRREPQHLGLPDIAGLVADTLLTGSPTDSLLHAWVLMPNHVHLLVAPHRGCEKTGHPPRFPINVSRRINDLWSGSGVNVPVFSRLHRERQQWVQRLKGRTAHAANPLLGRTGRPFWQDERYDHLVRNDQEFRRIERYLVQNPVTAGLATNPGGIPVVECIPHRGGLKPAGAIEWPSALPESVAGDRKL